MTDTNCNKTDYNSMCENNITNNIDKPEKNYICVSCPVTGLPFYIGLGIETKIICSSKNKRQSAVHYIDHVDEGSIATDLGLEVGQKLIGMGSIMTDGMRGINLKAQFRSLDIYNIELIIQRNKEDEINGKACIMYAELQLDPNPDVIGLCVDSTLQMEYIIPQKQCKLSRRLSLSDGSCRIVEVSEINSLGCEMRVAHPKVMDIVCIEHPKSSQYLKVENGKLIVYPLQERDDSMQFKNGSMGVYNCEKEPEIIFVFRENKPQSTAYITAINDDKVGIQDIPIISPDIKVLNSDDPRLFVHNFATSTESCFMSTALEDHYLAVTENKVVMKRVKESDMAFDDDIHFILRDPGCVLTN